MPRRKPEPADTIEDLVRGLAEGLTSQAKRPNINGYMPHDKQKIFHTCTQKYRLYIGGNRSGKTTGSVAEDIYYLRGNHPNRPVPEGPIRGRVVGVDFLQGVQKILIPEFRRWMPPSLLKNGSWDDSYNKELRTLTLTNGSFVEFMSYDQDTDKFAGTSRHFVHYDEEPPLHVFNECNARLVDTDGDWWISMTPVEGMSWVYDKIYAPAKDGRDPDVKVIEADMLDNPHISPEAAERYLKGLDKDERSAREHGTFVSLGGRVYKDFSKQSHVIEPINPRDILEWEWFISLDHGFNNPTAVLWHAVNAAGDVITFDEHYAAEMIIDDHAKIIHEKNTAHGKIPEIWVADPALAQRQGVTGTSIFSEYADRGCFFAPGNNDVPSGVARINQYLRQSDSTGTRRKWMITENCPNLIKEMLHLRWQTYSSKKVGYEHNKQEKINKKDDHSPDSARYMFSFMPDLVAPDYGTPVPGENAVTLTNSTPAPVSGTIDDFLAQVSSTVEVKGEVHTVWKKTEYHDLTALEYD